MTVCSATCCVLSSKEVNLLQPQLKRLPFQLRPQSFKHWKTWTSHGEKWEEQRLQVSLPFPFWFNGKEPIVISSWSPDCLSQCPPNAPSCQQACSVWKKEISLRKGCIWTEAFLQLLFTLSIAWFTAIEEPVTCRHDRGSQRYSTWHRPRAGEALDKQHRSMRSTRQSDGAPPMLWTQHRQVTFKQVNPNSAFLGIKCLPGKGHCL